MATIMATIIKKYTLELDEDEVKVLREVCSRIGGDEKTSRRGLMDRIKYALNSVGVLEVYADDIDSIKSTIYFLSK